MRSLLLSLFIMMTTVAPAPAQNSLQSIDQSESILVRIAQNQKQISLRGLEMRWGTGEQQASSSGPSRWSLQRQNNKWILREGQTGRIENWSGRELTVRGQFMSWQEQQAPDRLKFLARGDSFDVIAPLNMRDYLIGVVSHEMPTKWPLETLKAQAVAARSYALSVRRERAKKEWQVESTVSDQVFRHVREENTVYDNARKAVIETDGEILLDNKGGVLKAYYHADCGGQTARVSTVWGAGFESGSTVDESCPLNPKAEWTLNIRAEELQKRLRNLLAGGDLQSLGLVAGEGRVGWIHLGGSAVKDRKVRANDFRLLVGADVLKSTNFSMEKTGDSYRFKGRGFGHGVGLCQWGSKALGQKGWSSESILSHYYPRAALKNQKQFVLRKSPQSQK